VLCQICRSFPLLIASTNTNLFLDSILDFGDHVGQEQSSQIIKSALHFILDLYGCHWLTDLLNIVRSLERAVQGILISDYWFLVIDYSSIGLYLPTSQYILVRSA